MSISCGLTAWRGPAVGRHRLVRRYNHAWSVQFADRDPTPRCCAFTMSPRNLGVRPPTNDVVFPALRASIQAGRCAAVIGAGMSAGDYPIWTDLISQLQERCGLRSEDLSSRDPLDIAQTAKDKNPAAYFEALDEIFAPKLAPNSASRYHLLPRIGFISYLSLNIDPVLVDTFNLHSNVTVSDFPNLQAQNHGQRELFCIHGRLGRDRPAATTSIVLTRREFEAAYDPWGSPLHSFVQQTILAHDLCFLGCNPAEPYLARILESCKRHNHAQHGLTSPARPQWYLLADEGYGQLDAASDCGIHVVHYDKLDSHFTGMDAVLEYWANKRPPFLRPSGVQESRFNPDVEPDK